jgi:hypothetical protein
MKQRAGEETARAGCRREHGCVQLRSRDARQELVRVPAVARALSEGRVAASMLTQPFSIVSDGSRHSTSSNSFTLLISVPMAMLVTRSSMNAITTGTRSLCH